MGFAPKTQFVRRGDGHLAYQVFGNGPANVLYLNGGATHVENMWNFPFAVRTNERVAHMARLAIYDMRGWGMSDRLPSVGYTIEDLAADALAVFEAAGFEHAFLWGDTGGGAVAIWIAVHHPELVDGLFLDNAYASTLVHPGHEFGLTDAEHAARRDSIQAIWGTGESIFYFASSLVNDERVKEEFARAERFAATPTAVGAIYDVMSNLDVRELLPRVNVPTLVVHSATNVLVSPEHGRYLAEHIAGARYVEIADDAVFEGSNQTVFGEVAELLTGSREAAHIERSLLVVLFSDIVDSTSRAAALGDGPWRDLLNEYRGAVRNVLDRYGAREVNTRGDDFFAVVASPSVAVEIARAIRAEAAQLHLQVRSGLHLGEVEHQGDDFAGMAVHIGARVAALAQPGEILATQTVRETLIGSPIRLEPNGVHHLKGVPGEWQLVAVQD